MRTSCRPSQHEPGQGDGLGQQNAPVLLRGNAHALDENWGSNATFCGILLRNQQRGMSHGQFFRE